VPGTDWKWTQTLQTVGGDIVSPADSWTVTFNLLGKYSASFAAAAQITTNDWLFSFAAADTESIPAGTYAWRIIGSLAGIKYDLGGGSIRVARNPVAVGGSDQRTHAETMVAVLEAEIEARITGTGSAHKGYTIGDRAIEKLDIQELQRMLSQYNIRLQRERNGGRLAPYAARFNVPR
jgi:hypothetical protein